MCVVCAGMIINNVLSLYLAFPMPVEMKDILSAITVWADMATSIDTTKQMMIGSNMMLWHMKHIIRVKMIYLH